MIQYPQHEKLAKIKAESQAQGEFIDWLTGQGFTICEKQDSNITPWWPTLKSIESLLAEYHGIDQKRLEKEKRKMLEQMRAMNSELA